MAMLPAARQLLLSNWIQPSSANEQQQQERAERMVREAIDGSTAFSGSTLKIYTKGSYPNNTNVRRDSDVDVVVELQDCQYYEYLEGRSPAGRKHSPYVGPWTPATWRSAVRAALEAKFGKDSVDTSGTVAINVSAVPNSRPSADVVPSFAFIRYDDPAGITFHEGSCVFPTDGAQKIQNWPRQQLRNGRNLNDRSGRRYKEYVRALKNAENRLSADQVIKDLPSYFMECLVYNVPVATLKYGSLDDGFRETLAYLWENLDNGVAYADWVEPNELKWLFKGHQKWSVGDGKDLVMAAWNYLGYGS
ncbi:nucleotidyltransferase domain-containing protein [Jiangella alkaliphila]|uniref:cGAS/DncV-like nucleotidyltransferase C-terminal helical domain-containing protein n=1 Tax=Jiangella alkaliphila TaxID=419479 RepID=A0A1H2GB57_9ACTN|nr:nucleotidyltransferase [Jiangella alkaliphila]SDU16731.1 hypothetical protein SAMN04488563_0396 [Jiangella alkaliphila]